MKRPPRSSSAREMQDSAGIPERKKTALQHAELNTRLHAERSTGVGARPIHSGKTAMQQLLTTDKQDKKHSTQRCLGAEPRTSIRGHIQAWEKTHVDFVPAPETLQERGADAVHTAIWATGKQDYRVSPRQTHPHRSTDRYPQRKLCRYEAEGARRRTKFTPKAFGRISALPQNPTLCHSKRVCENASRSSTLAKDCVRSRGIAKTMTCQRRETNKHSGTRT